MCQLLYYCPCERYLYLTNLTNHHYSNGYEYSHSIISFVFYICEIRGAIFDVYNDLGPGLLESVYEEALAFELNERGLEVARQVEVPVIYKGNELKTPLRLDLLVNNQVIVELKSVEEMKPVFAKQLLTYLKLMDKRIGLLVNFNTNNLDSAGAIKLSLLLSNFSSFNFLIKYEL